MIQSIYSVVTFLCLLTQGYSLGRGLSLTNDCSCPGYNLTFECTVTGKYEGSTVWRGDVFSTFCMLPEITLQHRDFLSATSQVILCGNRIALRSVRVENNSYSSQVDISYNMDLIGRTVLCSYDNGSKEIVIGSRSILADPKPYPPPANVQLTGANKYQLIFWWNSVASECSAIHYNIIANNCGTCPMTTVHTTVACTGYHTNTNTNLCSFAVQTVFCGDTTVSNMSDPAQVLLRVPDPPTISAIVPRYSYQTRNIVGFIIQFMTVNSVAIADGIDGAVLSYTLIYNNSVTGHSCGSATVPISSCINTICQHSFNYENSDCTSEVNITVLATNILGNGPVSEPSVVQDKINTDFGVKFDLVSNGIMCMFHRQLSIGKKVCTINYGPEKESCNKFTQTSHSTSNVVLVGIPSQSLSSEVYCFSVLGNNGTHSSVIEGTFVPGVTNQDPGQTRCDISTGLSITFAILISIGIIIILAVIVLYLVRVTKRIRTQLLNAKTIKVPSHTTASETSACVHGTKNLSQRIYEDLDGNTTGGVIDIENISYHVRSRCATPCSDEAEEAYYSTV